MVEPENLTLVLLREMRADMDRQFGELRDRFDAMDKRLDAMQANGMRALKSFIGHRALVERAFGDYDTDLKDLKGRVATLEDARS